MAKILANNGDLDQTPHPAAFDLGLHCLQVTLWSSAQLAQRAVKVKWNEYILGSYLCLNSFAHSEKESTLKERKFSIIVFLLAWTLFLKEFGMHACNQEVIIIVSLVKLTKHQHLVLDAGRN